MAFDLLGLDGSYLMPMPLHERRRRLATVLEEAREGVWFSGLRTLVPQFSAMTLSGTPPSMQREMWECRRA
jgi:hypothetical protein